ncbi:hypothetical protein MUN84_07280 [Hymenobacter sp. 5516J-16]|uniref:hypothetical protein n=1 Tax=Hymenobacter sp. 5516J-16 TaxID=2932253 RepID=UPI001FD2F846|nr:hypothetical protein [Hymenobacter sp. 5516J-16]UOQ78371.1 hypothetical protein MUN84_07280 [Hymenobacter sp. 5516J-16]
MDFLTFLSRIADLSPATTTPTDDISVRRVALTRLGKVGALLPAVVTALPTPQKLSC